MPLESGVYKTDSPIKSSSVSGPSSLSSGVYKVDAPIEGTSSNLSTVPDTLKPSQVNNRPNLVNTDSLDGVGIPMATHDPISERPYWSNVWDGITSGISKGYHSVKDALSGENTPEKTSKESVFYNKNYDLNSVDDPILGIIPVPATPKTGDAFAKVNAPIQIGQRKAVAEAADKPDPDGEGFDLLKTVQSADNLYNNQIVNAFNDQLNQQFTTQTFNNVPAKIGDAAAADELHKLGYGYTEDENGKTVLAPISAPIYTPKEISTKLTTITSNFEARLREIDKEIRELTSSKEPVQHMSEMGTSYYTDTPTSKKTQEVDKKLAIKQAEKTAIAKQYGEVIGLYGNVANAQTYMGSTGPAVVNSSFLSSSPKDQPLDYKAMARKNQEAKVALDQMAADPELINNITNLGLQYTYVADAITAFQAQQALAHPGSGFLGLGSRLPQSTVDQWTLTGLVPNIKSLRSSIAYDKKVIEHLTASQSKAIEDLKAKAAKPGSRIDIAASLQAIQDSFVNTGMSESITAINETINSKQAILNRLMQPLHTGLRDLVALRSSQEQADIVFEEIKKSVGLSATVGIIIGAADKINGVLDFPGSLAAPLKSPEDIFKDYKVEGEITPMVDEVIEGQHVRVPFYTRDIKKTGEPINWDVLGYHAGGMAALLATFSAFEGPAALLGETILGGTAAGTAYEATVALKMAATVSKLTLKYAVPSMLLSSKESAKAELENKRNSGLDETSLIRLGFIRSGVEGLAFALNPLQMGKFANGIVDGSIKDIYKHQAYNALMDKTLTKLLGFKLNSWQYNMLMNAKYIPKGYLESAGTLTFQQLTALAGNALMSRAAQATADPAYYNPNYELSQKNILNTTISALATAVPFSIPHIRGAVKNTEYSRNSAMYQVAQAPDWFIHQINERLTAGEIETKEAYRQLDIIRQLKDIHLGLKEDFNAVDLRDELSIQKKHELKFELFRDKVREKGIIDAIASKAYGIGEVSAKRAQIIEDNPNIKQDAEAAYKKFIDEEGAKPENEQMPRSEWPTLEEFTSDYINKKVLTSEESATYSYEKELEEVSKSYLEHKKEIDYYDTLSPDEKLQYDSQKFWERNKQLLKQFDSYSMADLEKLRTALTTALDASTANPYLQESIKGAIKDVEISMAAARHGESRRPEFVQQQINDLIDKLVVLQSEAENQFDRTGADPEERPGFVQQFIESRLNSREKMLYDGLKRNAYQYTPDAAPENTVQVGTTYVEPEAGPQQELPQGPKEPETGGLSPVTDVGHEISITDIHPNSAENGISLDATVAKIKNGHKPTVIDLPTMYVDADGLYNLVSGSEQLAAEIVAGKSKVNVKLVPAPTITPPAVIDVQILVLQENWARVEESPEEVASLNTMSQTMFSKLTGVEASEEDGIVTVPYGDGELLVNVPFAIAYAGRPASIKPMKIKGKTTMVWVPDSDELDPAHLKLHSVRYFQVGDEFEISMIPIGQGKYEAKSKKLFEEGSYELTHTYEIPKDQVDAVLNNPVFFSSTQGTMKGYTHVFDMHNMAHIREGRTAGWLFRPGQDPVNNMIVQFNSVRDRILKESDHLSKGGKITGKIVGKSHGFVKESKSKELVNVKEVYKDMPELISKDNLVLAVRNPQDVRHLGKGASVINHQFIGIGRAVMPLPTSIKGKSYANTLVRGCPAKEEAESIVAYMHFIRDYQRAISSNNKALIAKLNAVSREFQKGTDEPGKYDLSIAENFWHYINQLVYAEEKTSRFIAPGEERNDLKNMRFYDFNIDRVEEEEGGKVKTFITLTWSEKRLWPGKLPNDVIINSRNWKELAKYGIYRYLINPEEDSDNEFLMRDLTRLLMKTPKNMNASKAKTGTKPYKIPLLKYTNGEYSVVEPIEAKTSGSNYFDYGLNNVYTTAKPGSITHEDGTVEYIHLEQPIPRVEFIYHPIDPDTDTEGDLSLGKFEKWWGDFKAAKTWKEASDLLAAGEDHYKEFPFVTKKLKELEGTKTYEEKKADFENAVDRPNSLLRKLRGFNNESSTWRMKQGKYQLSKEGEAKFKLLKSLVEASPGYTLVNSGKGTRNRTKYKIIGPNGSELKRERSFPAKLLDVVDGKIEAYGQKVGVEEATPFMTKYEYDLNVQYPDWDMSNAKLKTAVKQLEKGQLDKPAAQQMLTKIAEWKSEGDRIRMRNSTPQQGSVPFEKYFAVEEEFVEIDAEVDKMTEEEAKNTPEFATWEALTEEEKQQLNDQSNEEAQRERDREDDEEEGGMEEINTSVNPTRDYINSKEFSDTERESILKNIKLKYPDADAVVTINDAFAKTPIELHDKLIQKLKDCYT